MCSAQAIIEQVQQLEFTKMASIQPLSNDTPNKGNLLIQKKKLCGPWQYNLPQEDNLSL